MIIPQGNTEFDLMKSKCHSLENFSQDKNSNNSRLTFLIFLLIVLFHYFLVNSII